MKTDAPGAANQPYMPDSAAPKKRKDRILLAVGGIGLVASISTMMAVGSNYRLDTPKDIEEFYKARATASATITLREITMLETFERALRAKEREDRYLNDTAFMRRFEAFKGEKERYNKSAQYGLLTAFIVGMASLGPFAWGMARMMERKAADRKKQLEQPSLEDRI